MNLESSYFELIQPYDHAVNTPSVYVHQSKCQNVCSNDGFSFTFGKGMGDPCENAEYIGLHPDLTKGYHMYSYALDSSKTEPCGSTDYDKLTNASIYFTPTESAVNSNADMYNIYISCINHNIIRIENGALGFPIL